MNRLEQAQAIKKEHDKRRQIARDLASRRNLCPPKLSDKGKRLLTKVKMGVAVSHMFHANAGLKVDTIAQEEAADRLRVEHAKSAPALQIREPQPDGEVSHLRQWKGPDQTIVSSFRESTPWREQDERRTLIAAARQMKKAKDKA
jgi:hypothetical protein